MNQPNNPSFAEPDAQLNELSNVVIGAAIEVHRYFGPGFLEQVYEDSTCVELSNREIPYQRQMSMKLDYKGHPVGQGRIDLIVDQKLLVELKAVDSLQPIHTAQVMSYLKATGLQLGLLINFNVPLLKKGIERIVLTNR